MFKAIIIAVLAGAIATLPVAIILSIGMDFPRAITLGVGLLGYGVGLSLLVGLPISLLIFQFVVRNQFFSIQNLYMVANGVAACLTAVTAFLWGSTAIFFIGIPIFIAANMFAALGWSQIVEPHQADLND